MLRGAFHSMRHTHEFVSQTPGTLMIDVLMFQAPLGILGRIAEVTFLTRYMKRFLLIRNSYLKQVAEAATEGAATW